jgi:hypothetical protein
MLSAIKRKPNFDQAIQHYIKKSTLNLEHHTSAEAGTLSIPLLLFSSPKHLDI